MLETLTVVKTFCLWLGIPTSKRIGESKKPGFQNKNKPNKTRRHPENWVRHYAFRKEGLWFKQDMHNAPGAQVESSVPALRSIPSCERFSGVQLVCASYVPKPKLPCPHASLVFSWRQIALPRGSIERDPSAYLCNSGCTYGFSVQGHPESLLLRRRLARQQPQWCRTSGGFKKTEQAKASWNWWHAHLQLDVSPLLVTWMLSQLFCSSGLARQCVENQQWSKEQEMGGSIH